MARRPMLASLALVAACLLWAASPQEEQAFVAQSPALRATAQSQGSFAGSLKIQTVPTTAMQALPEPRPNDAMLPVELNRSSLYWGLLLFCVLSVLFSSYFFN
eukprot:TRINITY_DN1595_c0_g1_i4.p1 TRINITY_DN1595_c0_g1~~TRINITY_DN1595_c0_g1_i4.p1  ORF type:complete len:103 (-),score=25.74 TRINITY_DN1595_c0_g1_i4:16-324(-)